MSDILDKLPPPDRDLLLARFRDGWTQKEIASRLGVSQPAVNKRLTRLYRKIRRLLKE